MTAPTPTPDDNRILAMVIEHLALMDEIADNHDSAATIRDYAERFQPEPEARFYAIGLSVYDREAERPEIFSCKQLTGALVSVTILNSLHDAAKGGKTP